MKFHQISSLTKSRSTKKRLGRGIGSGKGKTAGRGTKGQNARSGGSVRPGFEGGQNPLMKRLPKTRGRKAAVKNYAVIHTDQLNRFKSGSKVTKQQLSEAGLIPSPKSKVKLLLRGDVKKAVEVETDNASQAAEAAIASAGGSIKQARAKDSS